MKTYPSPNPVTMMPTPLILTEAGPAQVVALTGAEYRALNQLGIVSVTTTLDEGFFEAVIRERFAIELPKVPPSGIPTANGPKLAFALSVTETNGAKIPVSAPHPLGEPNTVTLGTLPWKAPVAAPAAPVPAPAPANLGP